jgi:hypothetical protein
LLSLLCMLYKWTGVMLSLGERPCSRMYKSPEDLELIAEKLKKLECELSNRRMTELPTLGRSNTGSECLHQYFDENFTPPARAYISMAATMCSTSSSNSVGTTHVTLS